MPPRRAAPLVRTWTVLACAAVLGACSGPARRAARPPASTNAPAVSSSTTAPATSTSPSAAPLDWAGCAGHPGWDCATLEVPLDHSHPGRTIGIALSRHRAKTSARRGSLLVNPGGPGESGIDWAYSALDSTLDHKLVDDFDIIGFDPRGVGRSAPIRCADGPTLDRYLHLEPHPTTPDQIATVVAATKEFAAGCQARSGDLLRFVSTADAARDIDDIRAALGDAKLTYLGFSYGTYLGAKYAELFPTHIRAMTLDAAVDPTEDGAQLAVSQAVAFEKNLNAFLADCAATPRTCVFTTNGSSTLRAAFDALVARIDAHPIPVGGRSLGPGEALFGIAFPLYERSFWPVLAQGLEDAERGNGATLLRLFDAYAQRNPDGSFSNTLEANNAINCVDHPGPTTLDQYEALAQSTAKLAPYFGGPLAWGGLACLYWPVPATDRPGPVHAPGAPLIVVVGSTDDPATPYDGAVHLAQGLSSSVLVTRHGEGHAGYPSSSCVRADVDSYLIDLAPPADRDCQSSS